MTISWYRILLPEIGYHSHFRKQWFREDIFQLIISANSYLFKVNRSTRKRYTEHTSHRFLVFLLLNSSMYFFASLVGRWFYKFRIVKFLTLGFMCLSHWRRVFSTLTRTYFTIPNAISKAVMFVCNFLRVDDIYDYWQGDGEGKFFIKNHYFKQLDCFLQTNYIHKS